MPQTRLPVRKLQELLRVLRQWPLASRTGLAALRHELQTNRRTSSSRCSCCGKSTARSIGTDIDTAASVIFTAPGSRARSWCFARRGGLVARRTSLSLPESRPPTAPAGLVLREQESAVMRWRHRIRDVTASALNASGPRSCQNPQPLRNRIPGRAWGTRACGRCRQNVDES